MIEWSRVMELRDEVGAEDFDEVVELFLEEVDEAVTRLGSAPARGSIVEDLHFLKGSAMNLGFQEFAQRCSDGEKLSAAGQADGVNLNEVIDIYNSSRAEFLQNLNHQLRA